MPELRHRLRVRVNECDLQGVVFYANYLTYMDVAMTEYWREALGGYERLIAEGTDAMVAEARIQFRASARFDDELVLVGQITRLGTTSTVTAIEIRRERDGELLVEGELRHVFVDARTLEKKPIPEHARARLARFVAEPEPEPEPEPDHDAQPDPDPDAQPEAEAAGR